VSSKRTIEVTPSIVADLTVGEIEIIEQRTGRPITNLFGEDSPRGTVLHAIAHVILRREALDSGDPEPAWEDTADVKVTMAADEEAATSKPNPTVGSSRRTPRAR
jgi:hypothetical protein